MKILKKILAGINIPFLDIIPCRADRLCVAVGVPIMLTILLLVFYSGYAESLAPDFPGVSVGIDG